MLPALKHTAKLPWEDDFELLKADPSDPGVSIVIPIYNAGKFLEKTLRSLLCNDLTGCELILMDGGSTDDTRDIVEHYSEMFASITLEPDEGQSDAINKGFSKASKDILYWLNGDDIILPNTLSKIRREFANRPNLDVLVGNAFMTELDFTPINHFQFSDESITYDALINYAKNHLIQPSVFFTRKAWERVGPLDLSLHYAMDADLFIGMAREFEFRHIQEDIAYSVYHEDCKTRGKRAESISELAYVQSRHGGSEQARETLNILVGLFNELQSTETEPVAPPPEPSAGCERCEFLLAKAAAMRSEYEKNKELVLKVEAQL